MDAVGTAAADRVRAGLPACWWRLPAGRRGSRRHVRPVHLRRHPVGFGGGDSCFDRLRHRWRANGLGGWPRSTAGHRSTRSVVGSAAAFSTVSSPGRTGACRLGSRGFGGSNRAVPIRLRRRISSLESSGGRGVAVAVRFAIHSRRLVPNLAARVPPCRLAASPERWAGSRGHASSGGEGWGYWDEGRGSPGGGVGGSPRSSTMISSRDFRWMAGTMQSSAG